MGHRRQGNVRKLLVRFSGVWRRVRACAGGSNSTRPGWDHPRLCRRSHRPEGSFFPVAQGRQERRSEEPRTAADTQPIFPRAVTSRIYEHHRGGFGPPCTQTRMAGDFSSFHTGRPAWGTWLIPRGGGYFFSRGNPNHTGNWFLLCNTTTNLVGNYYFSNYLGDVVIYYLQLLLGEKLRWNILCVYANLPSHEPQSILAHPLARSCGQEPVSQSDSGVETAGCGPGSELGSSSETGSNRAFRIAKP